MSITALARLLYQMLTPGSSDAVLFSGFPLAHPEKTPTTGDRNDYQLAPVGCAPGPANNLLH